MITTLGNLCCVHVDTTHTDTLPGNYAHLELLCYLVQHFTVPPEWPMLVCCDIELLGLTMPNTIHV